LYRYWCGWTQKRLRSFSELQQHLRRYKWVRRGVMTSSGHDHPGFLNAVKEGPYATMVKRDSGTKHPAIRGEIFVNPKEGGG
jgi:hypothetical protein